MAPLNGESVGVGMPVIVSFDVAVKDKATIEKHLKVTSTPKQPGAWHWLSDNEVHWRPKNYWRAGTDVSVDVDVNSVPAGAGIFGQEDRHVEFHVGNANIYKVNAQTHQMQVFSNGKLLRTIPITTGKPGFTTRSGVKVIIEKFRQKRMNSETVGIAQSDPEYYDIDDVEYAMRVTYSGEFIHAAPWSVGSQGYANVSHGCTGMSTANAGWLYNMTQRGDVVEYTGTDRPMEFTNGYGDWNEDFATYAKGSALSLARPRGSRAAVTLARSARSKPCLAHRWSRRAWRSGDPGTVWAARNRAWLTADPYRPQNERRPPPGSGGGRRCVRSATAGLVVRVVVMTAAATRARTGPCGLVVSAPEGDVVGVAQGVVVELVTGCRVVEAGLELVLVLGVVTRLLELLPGRLLDVVGEHRRRQLGADAVEPSTDPTLGRDAVLVDTAAGRERPRPARAR